MSADARAELLKPILSGLAPESDIQQPGRSLWRLTRSFLAADLARMDEVEKILRCGVEGVITSLGGFPRVEGRWEPILQSNIIGCYNLFQRRHGAGRRCACGLIRVLADHWMVGYLSCCTAKIGS